MHCSAKVGGGAEVSKRVLFSTERKLLRVPGRIGSSYSEGYGGGLGCLRPDPEEVVVEVLEFLSG